MKNSDLFLKNIHVYSGTKTYLYHVLYYIFVSCVVLHICIMCCITYLSSEISNTVMLTTHMYEEYDNDIHQIIIMYNYYFSQK